jgi:outer membrane protein OmpA-like peptidoglycan-associated protein
MDANKIALEPWVDVMSKLQLVMGLGLLFASAAEAQDATAPVDTAPATAAATDTTPPAAPAGDVPAPATPDASAADSPPPPDMPPPPPDAPLSPHEIKLSISPLYAGPYIAPMFSYSKLGHDWDSKDGLGGELALGYRLPEHGFAVEVRGQYSELGSKRSIEGGTLDALVFPFANHTVIEGLYGVAGGGYLRSSNHPEINGSFGMMALQAGVGYLFGVPIGGYDLGIRAEVLGRNDERGHVDRNNNYNGPRTFNDFVFNLGLQLPLGKRKEAPPAPEPPVTVIPPVGEAPPPPPKPECRTPVPGERINLDGCGTGDVIVLNGVNFEFNKATLTDNAKTILNDVDSELVAHPDIKVELAGHTDGRGSESYNLKLSQRRAESVRSYLMEHGVDGDRMTAVGYGKTQPIASNDTDEGRALNRRTELRITASNGETASGVSVPTGVIDAAPAQPSTPAAVETDSSH